MPMSRASSEAPVTQYAVGNWLITGMRCCARFMRTCGMSRSAADFSSMDWTMSRWTSSGMSGPPPGVARTAIELYGNPGSSLRAGMRDYPALALSAIQFVVLTRCRHVVVPAQQCRDRLVGGGWTAAIRRQKVWLDRAAADLAQHLLAKCRVAAQLALSVLCPFRLSLVL